MKLYHIIISLLLILFSGCNPTEKELNNTNSLSYEIKPIKSKSILARAQLNGIIDPQKLELKLDLSNLIEEELHIKEIVLSTSTGLRSSPVNFNRDPIVLSTKRDTSLSFAFYPVNDMVLYKNTEMAGILKPSYNLSIIYTIRGKNESRAIDLIATLPGEKYQEYEKVRNTPITAYHFNTLTGFSTRQREYLKEQKLPGAPPFVHLSDQEIAVSGLNFQVKSYQRKDSLYAKILLVNHSNFSIKIDTTKLDFVFKGSMDREAHKNIILNKVTGSKEEYDMLRKGDRIIISFQRFRKESLNDERLLLAFKDSFILPTGNSLFYDHMELIKISANDAI